MTPRRTRVAILGGGCAGVAAAAELTATAERRRHFDVTIHQQGFRLGGKGATGRDPARGHRIEEHGLHVWMGFYRRSFGMMRRCFEEWDAPESVPIRTLHQAFAPHDASSFLGPAASDRGLDVWHTVLPPRPGLPWDEDDDRVDWAAFGRALYEYGTKGLGDAVRYVRGQPKDVARRLSVLGRLSLAVSRGLLLDVLPHGEAGFDRIDEYDLREWLGRHGAHGPDVLDAPLVRGLYNLAFAYPDGVVGEGRGRVAAGAGLKSILLILGAYRGAPFWRMRAGMGDTIFAPLYLVLRARGVRFSFFHRVERLRLSEDGRLVRAVDLGVQARPRRGEYDPLVDVGGQPCWPNRPKWEQLEDGERLAMLGVDFESNLTPFRQSGRTLTCGDDFDEVVLALPAPLHRSIAEELVARSDRYRVMVENTHSVATAAMQLWLRDDPASLGWSGPPAPLLTGMRGLFGTWGDMTDVGESERWPVRPGSIAYFCEAYPEARLRGVRTKGEAERRLRDEVRPWADDVLTELWPGARGADGRFREDLLLTADRSRDPLAEQYLRVNFDPSERYVLSLPGTTKYRLRPDASGFANVTLAGDWTRTRINGGSVEAAIESGQEAARALCMRRGVA